MTFKSDSRQDAREPSSEREALFSVAQIEVTIACPHCSKRQPSPDGSRTWKRDGVTRAGMGGLVQCVDCKGFFRLPVKLFDYIAGV
jgi:hypothetical protein